MGEQHLEEFVRGNSRNKEAAELFSGLLKGTGLTAVSASPAHEEDTLTDAMEDDTRYDESEEL